MDVVNSSCVGHTFRVGGNGEVRRHHAARIFVLVVENRIGEDAAGSLNDIGQRIHMVKNLIHLQTDFVLPTAVAIQWMNLNGLPNVSNYLAIALRGFLSWCDHCKEAGSLET